MFKTLRDAFRIKDLRKKLLYTFMMLVVVRFGSELPIPGVNTSYFADFFAKQSGDAFGFFNAMTGGSFTSMSVFALSITPYITSSIIMQLMTIAIPKLEEMQKDGEDGRKKILEYTRYVTVGLALIESTAMAVGFGGQGLLHEFNVLSVIVAIATMTAGSALLMWIGERITENGVGNGISIVLLINILSSLPDDMSTLYTRFLRGKNVPVAVVTAVMIVALIVAMVVFCIILQDAERRIPVQYSQKMQGRRMVGGQSSSIPLKVNTAGVIPVIFASSIMSTSLSISSIQISFLYFTIGWILTGSYSALLPVTSFGISISTGPGLPDCAISNALRIVFARSLTFFTIKLYFVIGIVIPVMSISWKLSFPRSGTPTLQVIATIGIESINAVAIPVTRFVAPGPLVAKHTPTLPVARAYPSAA